MAAMVLTGTQQPSSDLAGRAADEPGVLGDPPPSFKAVKPRKTKGLILALEGTPLGEQVHDHLDDRLVDDADSHEISARVASLIFQYVQEGDAKACGDAWDPGEDEFHESRYLRPPCCLLRHFGLRRPKRRQPGEVEVYRMISNIAAALYFCKQVVVLCTVYVERLLRQTKVRLTTDNWRSVVVAALVVASKVWEDIHPWNADFEACLEEVLGMRYRLGALYDLESVFLRKLKWQVHVDGEEYAAYFFSLLEGQSLGSGGGDAHPCPYFPRQHRRSPKMCAIAEEELHCGSDSDMERGVLLLEKLAETSPRHRVGRLPSPSCGSTHQCPSRGPPSPLPWSREELMSRWRCAVLQDGQGDLGGFKIRAIRDTWRLDCHNPHVGALRHAPRALAPSWRIPQSEELLWAHALALQTADVLGPQLLQLSSSPEEEKDAAHTLSGATGDQLASELRGYLWSGSPGGPLRRLEEREASASLLADRPTGYVGVSFGDEDS